MKSKLMNTSFQIKNSILIILVTAISIYTQTTNVRNVVYPTNTVTGTPVSISSGVGVTTVNVVTGIEINDRSTNGWTLTITSANGTSNQPRLENTSNNSTIDYSLEINNVGGILATGLTLDPAVNTPLIFNANSTLISPTGTVIGNSRTRKFTFDLRMTIADAATVGKLAGDYVDQLTMLIASDD